MKTVNDQLQALLVEPGDFITPNAILQSLYDEIKAKKDAPNLPADSLVKLTNYLLDWETNMAKENKGGQIKESFSKPEFFDKWVFNFYYFFLYFLLFFF